MGLFRRMADWVGDQADDVRDWAVDQARDAGEWVADKLGLGGSGESSAGAPPPGTAPADFSDQAIRDIQRMQRLASRGRLGLGSTFLTGPRGVQSNLSLIARRMKGA
jgi:hypothetical protein